ncbi:putative secreted protein with PEP-CTERM sorting signal [Pseudoduganella flava]|nr:putative secreted protein with PEP-CTERM sorting signal [Pseudoduganella flava]
MRKAIVNSLLGLSSLLGAGAHAASSVQTQAFTMAYGGGAGAGEIHLVSNGESSYRIAFDSMASDITGQAASGYLEAFDTDGNGRGVTGSTWGSYTFHVADGYRITGLAWEGSVYGGIEAGVHEDRVGTATTTFDLAWSRATPSGSEPLDALALQDLAGLQMFSLAPPMGTAYGQDFTLDFFASAAAAAQAVVYELPDGSLGVAASYAGIGLQDIALSVYVAPVPEPATYGMLLAGLGLLGTAARLRRR